MNNEILQWLSIVFLLIFGFLQHGAILTLFKAMNTIYTTVKERLKAEAVLNVWPEDSKK